MQLCKSLLEHAISYSDLKYSGRTNTGYNRLTKMASVTGFGFPQTDNRNLKNTFFDNEYMISVLVLFNIIIWAELYNPTWLAG